MGLYDGSSPTSLEGSSGEIAKLLASPVVLIAGAHGMSRSFAAQVRGYVGFESGVEVSAVIANHAGSARHAAGPCRVAARRRPAAARRRDPPRRARDAAEPAPRPGDGRSSSAGRGRARRARGRPGAARRRGCADRARPRRGAASRRRDAPPRRGSRVRRLRLGVAFDEAFHFYYADTFASLEQAGFELVRFSPLRDGGPAEGLARPLSRGRLPRGFRRGALRQRDDAPLGRGVRRERSPGLRGVRRSDVSVAVDSGGGGRAPRDVRRACPAGPGCSSGARRSGTSRRN